MIDTVHPTKRSQIMSRIRATDTEPEKLVRSFLHKAGFRFRLHDKKLPGKPDIVLAKYHTAIFVNGCFWHRHEGCKYCYSPKSRVDFWERKFRENVLRDIRNQTALKRLGWHVEVVWECEAKSHSLDRLIRTLSSRRRQIK